MKDHLAQLEKIERLTTEIVDTFDEMLVDLNGPKRFMKTATKQALPSNAIHFSEVPDPQKDERTIPGLVDKGSYWEYNGKTVFWHEQEAPRAHDFLGAYAAKKDGLTDAPAIFSDPLDIIHHECRVEGNLLFLPKRQLPPKTYQEVKRILTDITGKWNTSKQAFIFDRDPKPLLEKIATTGKGVKVKKELQAFYTPAHLATRMVKAASLKRGMRVLEPSAGEGAIVHALLMATPNVTAVENDAHALKTLEKIAPLRLHSVDFLTLNPDDFEKFDAVVMNPPFTKNQWIKHLLHAHKFLRSGGRLVCLAPVFEHRNDTLHSEVWRIINEGDGTVDDIPAGTFKESGTTIPTSLITLTKP